MGVFYSGKASLLGDIKSSCTHLSSVISFLPYPRYRFCATILWQPTLWLTRGFLRRWWLLAYLLEQPERPHSSMSCRVEQGISALHLVGKKSYSCVEKVRE